jgi:Kef-type K+ transport system membrane component KefB
VGVAAIRQKNNFSKLTDMGFVLTMVLLKFDFTLPLKDPVLVFALLLFIILLAPVILRKFRIPGIIGLIIAGLVIGPHGLNLLEGGLMAKGSSINLFGTVGLLYIMFLAGLELDLNEFRRNRAKSLLFGLLTFSFPFVLGVWVCLHLLHFSLTSSILIASMFSTHTLVAYPIASRLGLIKNKAVTVAVGGTIITDSAVLLILAVITGSAKGQLTEQFWIQMGISVILFVAVIFWGFPLVGRWFFKNVQGDNASQYIFVLAMVFLAGFMAELAGIEPIIGAFMAGLALNRLIPHTSPIMNRIEFVGNALFIPFFLIGVGMLVDMRVLLRGPEALLVAGTLIVVAFTGKWIAALLTQLFFRYSKLQRQVLFGLTSAHAAATLAVILIGYEIGLVNANVLNGTVILILVTCLVASFVTERAGRKLAIQELEQLPEISEGTEKILVTINNPNTIEYLIDLAIMMRDVRHNQAVFCLSVVKDDDEARERVQMSKNMMEKVLIHGSATDSKVEVITRVDLNVASGINRAATEIMATDLVIGWSDKNRAGNYLFGSTMGNILQSYRQTLYACRLIHPLSTTKKMMVVIPSNAEFEIGFSHWVSKVRDLASQAGARLYVCCTNKTKASFEQEILKSKANIELNHIRFDDLEDFLVLSRSITADDLLIMVSARKSTISFDPYMDNIPAKLNKHFLQNNFIMLYPEQNVMDADGAEDITMAPIQEQIENFNKLGKAVKRIFRPKPGQMMDESSGEETSPLT